MICFALPDQVLLGAGLHLTFTYPKYKVSNVSYSFLQTNGSTVTDLVTYYALLCLILFVLVQFEALVSYFALLCLFSFDFVFVQFEGAHCLFTQTA